MRIKILFDKRAEKDGLRTGWGFSCLAGETILFDTGENGSWLLNNMDEMKVDVERLEAVVISHDHWDHTGGLWELMKKRTLPLKVFGCPGFSDSFKKKVDRHEGVFIAKDGFFEIADGIFVTGEIAGQYAGAFMPEQALVIRTDKGTTVITGCAHPGIVKMLQTVRESPFTRKNAGTGHDGNEKGIYMAFGGFHLMGSGMREIKSVVRKIREMDVRNVGPTHCTGEEAEEVFAKEYKKNFISVKTGMEFEV